MTIDYAVLDQGSLVYARARGPVTGADLINHERKLLADPCIKRGYRQLLDYRWVADDAIEEGFLDRLAETHARGRLKLRGARYAMVAQGSRWFSLGNKYHCEPYGMTLIVFNDPSTACIWLGADFADLVEVWRSGPRPTMPVVDLVGAVTTTQTS